MVEDPKAGTPDKAPDDSGKPAGTPEPDPKVSAGGGTPDDKDARLTKLEADLAAERDLRLKHQGKVEEANRIIAENEKARGAKPPPTNGLPQDPLSALTDDDINQLLLLEKSDDAATRAVAKVQLANLRAAVITHDIAIKGGIESAIRSRPEADQKAVREAWESGKFRTVDDAVEHVALTKLSPLQQENEALKERVKELSKASGTSPPGTSPRGVGGGGGGGSDRKTITDSERARIMSDGSDKEKWDHIQAIRRGDLKVVSD